MLQEHEREWNLELEKALAEMRQHLAHAARRKTAAASDSLRKAAEINTEKLRTDFSTWLDMSVRDVAVVAAVARAEEVVGWECVGAKVRVAAVSELERVIVEENQEKVRRVVEVCVEQRREAVEKVQRECAVVLQQEREAMQRTEAIKLEEATTVLRERLGKEGEEACARVEVEEEETTAEQVRKARVRAREEMASQMLHVSSDFEKV